MGASHSEDERCTTNVLHWIPRERKRPRRRPNASLIDEIKCFAGATWIRIAAKQAVWAEKKGGLHPGVDRKQLKTIMILKLSPVFILF